MRPPSSTTWYSKPRVGHYPGEEGSGGQEGAVLVSFSRPTDGEPWFRCGSVKQMAALRGHLSPTAGTP